MAKKSSGDDMIFLSSSPLGMFDKLEKYVHLDALNTWREWLACTAGLKKAKAKVKASYRALSVETLRQAVKEDPIILHISGHGSPEGFMPEGTKSHTHVGKLVKQEDFFDDVTVKQKTKGTRNLKLVVLSACHSEWYHSVFIEKLGVPHVLCISKSDAAKDGLTGHFFGSFYTHLGSGQRLNIAHQQAVSYLCDLDETTVKLAIATKIPSTYYCQLEAAKYVLRPESLNSLQHGVRILPKPAKKENDDKKQKEEPFQDTTVQIPRNTLPEKEPLWRRAVGLGESRMDYSSSQEPKAALLLSRCASGIFNLIVLHGPAGIGKTWVARFVTQYAHRRRLWFPGGIFFLDRRAVDPTKVPLAMQLADLLATAKHKIKDQPAGKEHADTKAAAKWVADVLAKATGRVLLVLDNADKALAPDDDVQTLLQKLKTTKNVDKNVTVLMTRRRDLHADVIKKAGLNGTHDAYEWLLPPLRVSGDIVDKMMYKWRVTDQATHPDFVPPAEWKREDLDDWFFELFDNNPGKLELLREFALTHNLNKFKAFKEKWQAMHEKPKWIEMMEARHKRIQAEAKKQQKNLHNTKGGYYEEEHHYGGTTGWHSGGLGDHAESAAQRHLRRLKREHRALTKENHKLQEKVAQAERYVASIQDMQRYMRGSDDDFAYAY